MLPQNAITFPPQATPPSIVGLTLAVNLGAGRSRGGAVKSALADHRTCQLHNSHPTPKINRAIYSLFALYFRAFNNLIHSQKLTEQFTRYLFSNTAHTITTSASKSFTTNSSIHSLHFRAFDNLNKSQKLTEQFPRYLLSNTAHRGKKHPAAGKQNNSLPTSTE
jgi:hypothetical protein